MTRLVADTLQQQCFALCRSRLHLISRKVLYMPLNIAGGKAVGRPRQGSDPIAFPSVQRPEKGSDPLKPKPDSVCDLKKASMYIETAMRMTPCSVTDAKTLYL